MAIWVIEIAFIWLFKFISFRTNLVHENKRKKLFLILSFTMMTLILGFRSNYVGEDTMHYVAFFEKTYEFEWIDIFTGLRVNWVNEVPWPDTMEVGFAFIAKLVHVFTDNAQYYLCIIAIITSIGFSNFIYKNCYSNEDVFLGTYVYMCECLYMMAFNGARQVLAISIGINSYNFIKRKKYIKGLLLIIFASLFHNSAIVLTLMIPFMMLRSGRKERYYKSFKYILVGCIMIPCLIPVMNMVLSIILPRYTEYFKNNFWEIQIGKSSILWIIELLFVVRFYRSHFKNNWSFELSLTTVIYLMFELISLSISAFNRLAWYFRSFLILFFPIAVTSIKKVNICNAVRAIIYILLTLLFLAYGNVESRNYIFFLR